MGFFRSGKGERAEAEKSGAERYEPPLGPPPPTSSSSLPSSQQERTRYADQNADHVAPPPGPPPSWHAQELVQSSAGGAYAPPPGPPPSHSQQHQPGANASPYSDWTAVPDTSDFPPPPALTYDRSANNASWDAAHAAHKWCVQNPPWMPSMPSEAIGQAVWNGDVRLEAGREYLGELKQVGRGRWRGKTRRGCQDAGLMTNLPLWFAKKDGVTSGRIYFEVRVLEMRNADSGIVVGYCVRPYPGWRLPGWERGSVGVHGDDGRRFMSESFGGSDFVGRFHKGDVVGVGMVLGGVGGREKAEVFFVRNGRKEGGWMVNGERDAERSEGLDGLGGELDLYAAIGVFGSVEFEAVFDPDGWKYRESK